MARNTKEFRQEVLDLDGNPVPGSETFRVNIMRQHVIAVQDQGNGRSSLHLVSGQWITVRADYEEVRYWHEFGEIVV